MELNIAVKTLNILYIFHLASDIRCHSSSDNYWCFVYERLVRFYKLQSTNQKTLCKTFADRAAQPYFVTYFLEFANILKYVKGMRLKIYGVF